MLAFAVVKYLILTKKNFRFLVQKKKKRTYICVNRKELDKIYQRICGMSKKACFRWGRENCFICNRFKFIYRQQMHYIDNEKSKMLWKIYLKTNQYGFELKHVI